MAQAPSIAKPDLLSWHARAGAVPAVLAEALELCQASAVNQPECVDVLDLLAMLGCDAQTQAAALWFALAQVEPARWDAVASALLEDLRRERGLTVVVISHDFAGLEDLCPRTLHLRNGVLEPASTAVGGVP